MRSEVEIIASGGFVDNKNDNHSDGNKTNEDGAGFQMLSTLPHIPSMGFKLRLLAWTEHWPKCVASLLQMVRFKHFFNTHLDHTHPYAARVP
eukprot:6482928-Amphidinium_carterae.1